MKARKVSQTFLRAEKAENSQPPVLNEKQAQTNYLDISDKIAKPIKNYLGLYINTSLNHMSIRYRPT